MTSPAMERIDLGKKVEREGVRIAIRYLRQQGLSPRDVSDRHRGYDLIIERRRVEVKASTKNRAWMEVDIRKSCEYRVDTKDRKDILRRGLPFDEIVEVTRIGRPDGPKVYRYPVSAVLEFGEFHTKTMWNVHVPEGQRETFLLRSLKRKRHTVR